MAPKHHRNHPRVAVPSKLTVEQLRSAPFESNALEPCGDDDAATMSRQIRKRRAYPVACAARCRHGFARRTPPRPSTSPPRPSAVSTAFPGTSRHPGRPRGRRTRTSPSPEGDVQSSRSIEGIAIEGQGCARVAERRGAGGARAGLARVPAAGPRGGQAGAKGGHRRDGKCYKSTPALSVAGARAHRSAVSVRRWMLPSQWTERVERDDGFEQIRYVLFRTGLVGVSLDKEEGFVGGWRGNRVKCLHAQLGDALVRGRTSQPRRRARHAAARGARGGDDGFAECWRECAASDDPRRDAR